MNDWQRRHLILEGMMRDAFDDRAKAYQDHADLKRHYLSRSERLHSWEDNDHPIRKHRENDHWQ